MFPHEVAVLCRRVGADTLSFGVCRRRGWDFRMRVGLWATEDDGVARNPPLLSRPPGPARRLLCIWSVSAAVPPPVSGTRGRRGRRRRSFTTVRSLPWALRAACDDARFHGSVPRVRRSPVYCRLPLSLGCGAGEAEAGSVVTMVLAGSPAPWASPSLSTDRCGDSALSWAGPKPRQARDGRSWRTGPLFSSCPRASRLSSPPLGGVWKAGVRNPAPNPALGSF